MMKTMMTNTWKSSKRSKSNRPKIMQKMLTRTIMRMITKTSKIAQDKKSAHRVPYQVARETMKRMGRVQSAICNRKKWTMLRLKK